MRIGILGDQRDEHVAAVSTELERLAATVAFFPPTAIEDGQGFALIDGEVLLDDEAFGDVSGWWVRGLPMPSIPRSAFPSADAKPEKVFELGIQARERVQIVLSWLCELEELGYPVINPPRSGIDFVFKPYQLSLLRRAGVPVPRTLYTSSPAAARAFRAEVGPSIVKPIAGGAHTRDFDSEDVQATLHLIQGAPIVVQERVHGERLRVTVVGEEIVSAVVVESDELDDRDDPEYHAAARYREAELSEEGRQIAFAAARASRLVYTGIDVLRDQSAHVVLECNSSPIYLDIERKMGHPISAKLAGYLYERARTAPTP